MGLDALFFGTAFAGDFFATDRADAAFATVFLVTDFLVAVFATVDFFFAIFFADFYLALSLFAPDFTNSATTSGTPKSTLRRDGV